MTILIPSLEDFQSHDGLHYHILWKQVGDSWHCPSCMRSKYQIMRWTKRFPKKPNPFMGWVAALHTHHDHGIHQPGTYARFDRTVICDQCNSADGAAKRKLKLPVNFSFSPTEIGSFVTAVPHGAHTINYETALSIYQWLAPNNLSQAASRLGLIQA